MTTSQIGFLRHIQACTRHDPSAFVPFQVSGKEVGRVRHDMDSLWRRLDGFVWGSGELALQTQPDTYEARTQAVARAARAISAYHQVPLHGEIYPLIGHWGQESYADIDRAAIPWFGVKGCGVHVNGIVRKADGLYFWIGQRSASCSVDPGKLDLMIGGGLPLGLTIQENVCKEGGEEAGLPADLARQARHVSTLSYKLDLMGGLRNDTLFVHDLELPESFEPRNTDGEVGRFQLMSVHEVAEIIRTTDRFKFNCNLVLIDRLLAHNVITLDDQESQPLITAMGSIRETL